MGKSFFGSLRNLLSTLLTVLKLFTGPGGHLRQGGPDFVSRPEPDRAGVLLLRHLRAPQAPQEARGALPLQQAREGHNEGKMAKNCDYQYTLW